MISSGSGRLRIRLWWKFAGEDLIVFIGGGREHVGSASICDGKLYTARRGEHMDFVVSDSAVQRINRELGITACVICGIHVDNASEEEIRQLVRNADECVKKLVERIRTSDRRPQRSSDPPA